ncbi:MAG TPA: TetR/AcrR family transcriptional regulator [Phenylobacterium sp.]|uniref:TetR/AcrR family transcriptional regulator n=1 Tax=Phenylobacterium sp. TaxID=1871053 RepID=UPI002B4A58A2|nr:TetR/AcrR family transcriptional regulator [Phenylobacterium sp.]HKR88674.1 TetR/AcrR family transcriptional regulator [Phenylobacterium sp.]
MEPDDNNVNLGSAPARKAAYHHGDLRAAAIRTGLQLLEERGADEVSLREIARRAGVSATALYRHFPDKDALLAALADEGLALLGAEQRAAGDAAGGGIDGFNATGRAYVRFALAHPALFRLIFSKGTKPSAPEWSDKNDEAMRLLMKNASELAPPEAGEAAAKVFALRAWALVHGLSVLLLDGQISEDLEVIDAVIDAPEQAVRPCIDAGAGDSASAARDRSDRCRGSPTSC